MGIIRLSGRDNLQFKFDIMETRTECPNLKPINSENTKSTLITKQTHDSTQLQFHSSKIRLCLLCFRYINMIGLLCRNG